MKITNQGVANTSLPAQSQVEETGAAQAAATSVAPAGNVYTASPALAQLIQRAGREPEVREDRVQAASARLREGYYHTQASAAQTAAAMLNRLD